MKKNVVIFMPFIGGGGVEKNLFIITNFFSKKFKNIFVCTSSKKYKYKFNNNIKFLCPKKNIDQNKNLKIKYLVCLLLLFQFIIKNRNTIVFAFQANIYCIILCKLLKIKVIARSNSSPSGWYHNPIKKILYKRIITMADVVIVNSREFQKQMLKRFKINSKCIYNPLDVKKIKKKSKIKSKQRFFDNNSSVLKLINIGRFTEQKDQITILKAINLIKKSINLKLMIVGRGVEREKLVEYIKENNLKKIVKLQNFIENPYYLISLSDLFILSSKYEGLPNVLLESVVLKKFIISTNCPTGPSEILIKNKGSLFFNIGNYKDLSKKIIHYYFNRKKLDKETIYPFKNLKKFNYNNNLKEYSKVVNSLI